MRLVAQPPPRVAARRGCVRRLACTASGAAPVPPSRRALLHGAAASALLLSAGPGRAGEAAEAEAEAAAAVSSALAPLLSATELQWPGPSFGYQKQLYYPPWLFGEWRVSSKLVAFSTPRGESLAPRNAAKAARQDMDAPPVAFRARFYSTLPDTAANNFRVALGALPQDAIVADRAFNCASLANATARAAAPDAPPDAPPVVSGVEYDPRESPDALRVSYLGGGRAELFLSAMRGDPLPEGAAPAVFHTAECSRQTSLTSRGVDVADYQIVSRFERLSPSRVALRQRVGVYLTPQAERYFDALNTAVALYDYELVMDREESVATEGGGTLVCVQTPKDVVQCL